jgi:hypothetical protein
MIVKFFILRSKNPQIKELSRRTILTWAIAVTLWILDKVMCDFWMRINAPVLHSIFHVLILLSSNCTIVLYGYFKAAEKASSLAPNIAYWPQNITKNYSDVLCFPYIYFSKLESKDLRPHPAYNSHHSFHKVNEHNAINRMKNAKYNI